jgi:hypothetical protein
MRGHWYFIIGFFTGWCSIEFNEWAVTIILIGFVLTVVVERIYAKSLLRMWRKNYPEEFSKQPSHYQRMQIMSCRGGVLQAMEKKADKRNYH